MRVGFNILFLTRDLVIQWSDVELPHKRSLDRILWIAYYFVTEFIKNDLT